jgi:hypothetical protein
MDVKVLNYPAAVEFDGGSVLLVVGDECACDSSYNGTRWYVSQSGPQLQRLPLSSARGQYMRGDLVAWENECRHYY